MTFEGYIRGDGSNATTIRIRNLHTGYYLTSGGAWQSGTTNFASVTSSSYTQCTASFTVEAFSTTYNHLVDLWIEVKYAAAANFGYADDFALWPHWDFVSIHGHNLGTNLAVEARSSDDNFSADDNLQLTLTRTVESPHTFYDQDSALVTDRYFRLLFDGDNLHDAIELNQLVVGEADSLSFGQIIPYPITLSSPQIRYGPRAVNVSQFPTRAYGLRFGNLTLAKYREFLTMIRQSEMGAVPSVIVPDDTYGDVCFGHIRESTRIDRIAGGLIYESDLVFEEGGFGAKVA
jgi:hypothetical protein